ncbi:hypothetical protein ACOT81_39595 [Streptomyces sp. WI04-05B]|uniref:Integrase n=1 Tax=Streptomyces turgidiscabies (strain Car8) TaxID=698760 RepID=L7F409_STRT8|nr:MULTISPECIES: hypothetical protein [Streptomyces]ELP65864.1 hypothetical protein STRTUCAR8_01772 [Streptomyces turgidiscabies Car8]MDX2548239.1 hypothetical protein [Streptomyces sp. WI04-05B]MDX2590276.1 hypothetical protein [Streptomyces sp. WI04-05A]MDX3500260.1 hypothetical protein [Streptomyces turgidiscabies]
MLLRLACLGVANVFALLRLLPVSNQDKDAEILALRQQITVLKRRLGRDRVRFAPSDRVFLAALLHRLPRGVLRRARLLVRPDTVLHWHRDLVPRRHAARSRPGVVAMMCGFACRRFADVLPLSYGRRSSGRRALGEPDRMPRTRVPRAGEPERGPRSGTAV